MKWVVSAPLNKVLLLVVVVVWRESSRAFMSLEGREVLLLVVVAVVWHLYPAGRQPPAPSELEDVLSMAAAEEEGLMRYLINKIISHRAVVLLL